MVRHRQITPRLERTLRSFGILTHYRVIILGKVMRRKWLASCTLLVRALELVLAPFALSLALFIVNTTRWYWYPLLMSCTNRNIPHPHNTKKTITVTDGPLLRGKSITVKDPVCETGHTHTDSGVTHCVAISHRPE